MVYESFGQGVRGSPMMASPEFASAQRALAQRSEIQVVAVQEDRQRYPTIGLDMLYVLYVA
jgi:hypothetical protein